MRKRKVGHPKSPNPLKHVVFFRTTRSIWKTLKAAAAEQKTTPGIFARQLVLKALNASAGE